MKKKRLLLCSIIALTLNLSACNLSDILGSILPKHSSSESENTSISDYSSQNEVSSYSSMQSEASSNYVSSSMTNSGELISSSTPISSSEPQPSSVASSSTPAPSSSVVISSSTPEPSSSVITSSQPVQENITLDIFAFNDIHGNVRDTADKGLGIAKTTTLLKELSKDKNSIFISQGDMWQGSVESNYTRGNLVTEWMNSLNFVSMTVGNHEYDWGKEAIIQNQELANFPTLGINVLDKNTNTRVDYLSPSTTFMRGNAKIGVIGAIGNCLSSISSSKVQGVYFATGNVLTNLVKQESNRLRNEEHCDFIIYSIHGSGSRDEEDSYDLSLSSGHYVDLVLEGHTHSNYAEKDDAGIYHVQCYGYNQNFYNITVDLDLTNDTFVVNRPVNYNTSYNYSPYVNYPEDSATNALFDKYYDRYAFAYETVGYVSEFKDPNTLRSKAADLYLEAGLAKWGANYNITLGGGYMSCRGSGLYPGEVKYSDLNDLFPFDNDIVLCSVKGSNFKNTQYITGSSNYFVTWTDYGNSIKNNINDNATYYLVTDTYGSDYKYNYLTVIDTLEVGGSFARDLLADYIRAGNWYEEQVVETHEGTVNDPKTIKEALDLAEQYPGNNVNNSGSVGYFFKGEVSRQAKQISSTSGDMNNLYVKDSGTNDEILIYYISRNQYKSPNWSSIDDLQVGDTIIFYGRPFYYNSSLKEIGSGAYVYSINGVLTD